MPGAMAYGAAYCKVRVIKSNYDTNFINDHIIHSADVTANLAAASRIFNVKADDINSVEYDIYQRHIDNTIKIFKTLRSAEQSIIKDYFNYFDIMNLKKKIRTILSGLSVRDEKRYFDLRGYSSIPTKLYGAVDKMDELIKELKGTPYLNALRKGMLYFTEQQDISHFDIELNKLLYSKASEQIKIWRIFNEFQLTDFIFKLKEVYETPEDDVLHFIPKYGRFRDAKFLRNIYNLDAEQAKKLVLSAASIHSTSGNSQIMLLSLARKSFSAYPFSLDVIFSFVFYERIMIKIIASGLFAHYLKSTSDYEEAENVFS